MTIKELLDKIKRHDCEPGVFSVSLMAGGHYSGYNACVDFRSTSPGAANHVSTRGNTPEEALASLLSILEEKWGRCPHCGGYLNGEEQDE